MKATQLKTSLKDLLTEQYLKDMAESHIECWKDRYFRKSKSSIRFDLQMNHDNCLEIERVQEDLGRELTSKEQDTVVSKFISAVVKNIY